MGGKRGFLAFVLAAVFLFALVSAASFFSRGVPQQNNEHSRMLASRLQLVAIKQAAYSSFLEAARIAEASALATKQETRSAIRAALIARAISLEAELQSLGYDASFWCGAPSEESLSSTIISMKSTASTIIPAGASQIASPQCAGTFDTDVPLRKIHINSLGFSLYSHSLGSAQIGEFPSSYEVDY